MNRANLTILKAAQSLPQPFTAQSLTVAAWKLLPEEFGLKGFEDLYPDHNRVFFRLCGKRGLVAKGYLILVQGKYWSVPEGGVERQRELAVHERMDRREAV